MIASRTFQSGGFGAAAGARSLGKPPAVYPNAVATDSDLIIAVDRQQTTLLLPMTAIDTTMTVLNPATVTAYNLLSIGDEIVKTTGPAGGNVVPVQRGFDGTTAAAHAANATVLGMVDAYHHNGLVAEIEAVETALGPNLSNISGVVAVAVAAASPFLANSAYQFPAQSPGGSLVAGANVITLTPVPKGVNGSDTSHYLYISGGTGTAEAALIVGGTAVAGAATGTLIVQCANTHSGAWTIQTATIGMQEALITAGAGGRVVVNKGGTVYAPTTLGNSATVDGTPGAAIASAQTGGNVFTIAADNCAIQGCTIAAAAAASAISNSGARAGILVSRCQITGSDNAVYFTAGTDIVVANCQISGFRAGGIAMANSVGISWVRVVGNYVSSIGSTAANAAGIGCWGSHTIIAGNIVRAGGNQDQAIVWLNNPGAGLTDGLIVNNLVTLEGISAFEGIGIGSATDFVVAGNVVRATVVIAGPAACDGIEINGSSRGSVVGNVIDLNEPTTPTTGIIGESISNVIISGNQIRGYGANSGSSGLGLVHTSATNPASGAMRRNIVSDNIITQTIATATAVPVRMEALVTGDASGNRFSGNIINGNTTTGFIGMYITNSASADMTGTVVDGNSFNNCKTGLQFGDPAIPALVANNRGLDDVLPAVASAATLAFPVNPSFTITGTAGVGAVTGLWPGRRGTFICTSGAVAFTAGATIGATFNAAQGVAVMYLFDGTKLWLG